MAAMAIYGLLAYLLSLHYPRQAWWIKLGAAGLILAIGASRMLLGVHWPTDVLGGYAAGACVLCAGVYWYEGHTGRTDLLKPHANVGGDA
jgi:undecaprenyl-diphosphatase